MAPLSSDPGPNEPPLGSDIKLENVAIVDDTPGSASPGSNPTGSGPDYDYRPTCQGETDTVGCTEFIDCVTSAGAEGKLYDATLDGVVDHRVCLADGTPGQITPGSVVRAFRALHWPASPLIIQPPGGRTLVNFETNLLTSNTEPTTRRLRLLGQRITIRATPATYTWVHGDGTTANTTDPGARYPDLRVTHTYQHTGTVQLRLDTTYTGRYRIGNGPWITIPDTHIVRGQPQNLTIIEATPTLVTP